MVLFCCLLCTVGVLVFSCWRVSLVLCGTYLSLVVAPSCYAGNAGRVPNGAVVSLSDGIETQYKSQRMDARPAGGRKSIREWE